MKSESEVLQEIRRWIGNQPDVAAWRNSVGTFENRSGIHSYGLGKGSADLIGIVRHSSGIGRFIAIEAKAENGGKQSAEQIRWLEFVESMGGVAGFASNLNEAIAIVERARK